jgi:subfamily B ATP-binding cassette protein MsbA
MKTYLRVIKYALVYKRFLIGSMVLSVLFSIFSALSVYLTIPLLKTLFMTGETVVSSTQPDAISGIYAKIQSLFETYILSSDKIVSLSIICILIGASFLLKNLTGFFQSILMQLAEKNVLKDIRKELNEKINRLSIRYFTNERTGNLISRMTNDVNSVQAGISAAFLNLVKEPLMIIIFLLLSLSISWKLTLLSFIIFPLTLIAIVKIGESLRRRSLRVQKKLSDLLSVISETIYGAKVIRAFRAENFRNNIFQKENHEHYSLIMRSAWASELTSPITEIFSIIAGIIIIWYGGNEILLDKTLQPEEFLGFLFILFQLIPPIKNLSTVANRIQESRASGERIFEILDSPVEVEESGNPVTLNEFSKNIMIDNVSFFYDEGKTVLKNINFEIKKSEVVAIVGSSGSGKTTLADLIARFYDVTKGAILIDGFNIKDISTDSLRKLTGLVPQETILFNDTIRNNILFGLENIPDKDIEEAAKFANAYNFIMDSKDGFETIIGERGLKLSGGQKQRLSIARAILRNPQILILDEATSSLDSESEMLVQEALDNMMKNRTSIVIAHRLSTIKNANKIIVLNEGRIVQIGNHQDLMSRNDGLYKALYELQFGKKIEEE